MSDYYTESQMQRIEQAAYDGAMLEAGKEWERQRYEFDATEAELAERVTELEAEVTKCHELQDSYCDRIAELEAAQKEVLSLLPELERGHYYCDDCWYSCPKAVDGCCDESQGDECNCGAGDYNALLANIIGLLTSEVQK